MTKPLLTSALLLLLATATSAADKHTVTNAGIGGHNSANLLARLDKDVLAHHPQLVILMVGTNDVLNSGNSIPLERYGKNLEQLASRITRSGSRLILMTIPPCHEPYLLQRHPPAFYGNDGPNGRIQKANSVIRQTAKKHGLPLVEINAIFATVGRIGEKPASLIRNKVNSATDDGVHPTADGYRLIATTGFQTIRDHSLSTERVICLGDSITFGAGVKGSGTTTGETYPAVLQRLLNSSQVVAASRTLPVRPSARR